MGREELVARIISDAEEEAAAIIRAAEERADEIVRAAAARAEEMRGEAEKERAEKTASVLEGKKAAARLDAKKILLGEKRRVIDTVYERALDALLALENKETLALADKLLKKYAREGDEIVFAANFPCAAEVAILPVVAEKKLTIASERAGISGGFLLRGKVSDTDLSYAALLNADRESYQTELAQKLFRVN